MYIKFLKGATYSIRVQEVGADLRCKSAGIFRAEAQVSFHGQIKQLQQTHVHEVKRTKHATSH